MYSSSIGGSGKQDSTRIYTSPADRVKGVQSKWHKDTGPYSYRDHLSLAGHAVNGAKLLLGGVKGVGTSIFNRGVTFLDNLFGHNSGSQSADSLVQGPSLDSGNSVVTDPSAVGTSYVPAGVNSGSASGIMAAGTGVAPSYGSWVDQIKAYADANTAQSIAESNRQAEITRNFNAQQAALNRDWQEYMSSTAHQREVADLKAAGLNPILSAMGGNGAAVTSGATASSSMPNSVDVDKSASQSIVGLITGMLASQATMTAAQTSASALVGSARISAEASKYGSDRTLGGSYRSIGQALYDTLRGR